MLIWAIYDISKTGKRTKLAQVLKDAGLYRVQKSVFLGNLERNRLDELALECKPLIDPDTDALYLFPMCEPDFQLTLSLGKALQRELVSDEVLSVIL